MTNSMWAMLHILLKAVSLMTLITSFPVTNSLWVTLHILWKTVSSHPFLWPTASEWNCTFCEKQSHHIHSCDQKEVSDITHFVKGSLTTSFPMTNRKWVTLPILWRAVSSNLFWPTGSEWHCTLYERLKLVSSNLFLWPTAGEWYCKFCERQSHQIFSTYDQQGVSDIAHFIKGSHITSFQVVSDIAHFVKGSLITSFCVTNSLSVTLQILWKAVSSHLFLWPTGSKWHCTFYERQLHHTLSHDKQQVSNIAHFVKGTLIRSFPMTNSMWVVLHILWKAVSSHLTNRMWVILNILWKAVSSHLFLQHTASWWHCTFCER